MCELLAFAIIGFIGFLIGGPIGAIVLMGIAFGLLVASAA